MSSVLPANNVVAYNGLFCTAPFEFSVTPTASQSISQGAFTAVRTTFTKSFATVQDISANFSLGNTSSNTLTIDRTGRHNIRWTQRVTASGAALIGARIITNSATFANNSGIAGQELKYVTGTGSNTLNCDASGYYTKGDTLMFTLYCASTSALGSVTLNLTASQDCFIQCSNSVVSAYP